MRQKYPSDVSWEQWEILGGVCGSFSPSGTGRAGLAPTNILLAGFPRFFLFPVKINRMMLSAHDQNIFGFGGGNAKLALNRKIELLWGSWATIWFVKNESTTWF